MKNKTLIQIMIVGAGLIMLTFIMTLIGIDRNFILIMIQLGAVAYKIPALVLLVKNGTTINTKYLNYFKLSVVFTLLGILFKVMNWPYYQFIILAGLLAGVAIYVSRFAGKTEKGVLDIMKVSWFVIVYLGVIAKLFDQKWGDYVILFSELPFIAMLVYFIQKEKKSGTLYNR